METSELLSYFVNFDKNILEVSFRTKEDSEDVFRSAEIDFDVAEEYGLIFETDDFDFYPEEFDDEDEDNDYEIKIDSSELISFLNEYYNTNPDELPEPELY